MDVAETKTAFPAQNQVDEDYATRIRFPLTGSAAAGLWNRKLEFGAEVICSHPHSAMRHVADYPAADVPVKDDHSSRRRAFRVCDVPESNRSDPGVPVVLLRGQDVVVSMLNRTSDSPAARKRILHSDMHMLYLVHSGSGVVRTDFGVMPFRPGDFIHIPRGTVYSVVCSTKTHAIGYGFLGRLMTPKHYWIDGYPISLDSLESAKPAPIDDPPDNSGAWQVLDERHSGGCGVLEYPFSPFDAVAWQGQLYPFVLHLEDIRTLASPNFHLDPKALTVFVTEDETASIQVFKPRWIHSLPYIHSNHVTEVLFNHKGYRARPGVGEGVATMHPPGSFHGPDLRVLHAENTQESREFQWSDEVAVMLESRAELAVMPAAEAVEVKDYDGSWSTQYEALP